MHTRGRHRNIEGFTLVEILVVVAIIALLARVSIPYLFRARMSSNEAFAQTVLRAISTAGENYASDNGGIYPTAIADLTGTVPPYLNEDYTAAARRGYTFACGTLAQDNYSCTATPVGCNNSGQHTFTIVTGGVLNSVDC